MQIHSLELTNVKNYTNETIVFSPGANTITGPNGAGKTTILEAIGFALFDHRPGKLSDFVREGQDTGVIRVVFSGNSDERAYLVDRSFGSSSHYSVKDIELGTTVCSGKADVIQFICSSLDVSDDATLADLFKNAIGVPQGSLTTAFLMPAGVRKSIFDPLLKISDYRKAFDGLRSSLSYLGGVKKNNELIIASLEGETRQLPLLIAERARLDKDFASAQTEMDELEERASGLVKTAEEMEDKSQSLEKARVAFECAKWDLAGIENNVEDTLALVAESEQASQVVVDSVQGKILYEEAQGRLSDLNESLARRNTLQERRSVLAVDLERIIGKKDAVEDSIRDVMEAQDSIPMLTHESSEEQRFETLLKDTEEARIKGIMKQGEFDVHNQNLTDANKRHEQMLLDQELAGEAVELLKGVESEILVADREDSRLRDEWAEVNADKKILESQQANFSSIAVGVPCPVCSQDLSPQHREYLLADLDNDLSEKRSRLEDISTSGTILKGTRTDLDNRRKTHVAVIAKQPSGRDFIRVSALIKALQFDLVQIKSEISDLTQMVSDINGYKRVLGRLRGKTAELERVTGIASRWDGYDDELYSLTEQLVEVQERLDEADSDLSGFDGLDGEAKAVRVQVEENHGYNQTYQRAIPISELLQQRREMLGQWMMRQSEASEIARSRSYDVSVFEKLFSQEDYDDVRESLSLCQSRLSRLQGHGEYLDSRMADVNERVLVLEGQERKTDQVRGEMIRLKNLEEHLTALRLVISESSPRITAVLAEQVSHGANNIFGKITGRYGDFLSWTDDYGIVLETNGSERAFLQLSGGEQMVAALSIRLALLQSMSEVAVAFFDEPTVNLDDDRRATLAHQMMGIEGFEQFFIISHDDSFEQYTENLIRIEQMDGSSHIVLE